MTPRPQLLRAAQSVGRSVERLFGQRGRYGFRVSLVVRIEPAARDRARRPTVSKAGPRAKGQESRPNMQGARVKGQGAYDKGLGTRGKGQGDWLEGQGAKHMGQATVAAHRLQAQLTAG